MFVGIKLRFVDCIEWYLALNIANYIVRLTIMCSLPSVYTVLECL